MEEFSNYTFRALTRNHAILIFILIFPVFITIYLLMDKFIFYDVKVYNVFSNMKVIGIPMILTYFLLAITANYILGNKYWINIKDNEITIYRNNKIFHSIELNQVHKIVFFFSSKQNNGYLLFNCNNIKLFMFMGVLLTKKKDFIMIQNYFNTILYPYLLKNNFTEIIQEQKGITIYTLIKKK
ncbi:hypothetical protein ETU08_00365 [Apibacter muscae]|uniref:hypothetical protein n=1 Tax=Apibacter muscae TaxID=2509004 RepID=UPI0011ADBB44|nr:hypothetical protein [Apibacter muscae]TWP31793.1 hypothetical protein ETU08_00365 [Apibacter muscae]